MPVSEILYKSFYWKIIHVSLSLITTISLAHILKPSISSAFYSLLYLFSLITVFFSLGMDIGLNYFLTRKELTLQNSGRIILLITTAGILIFLPCMYFLYRPATPIIISKSEIIILGAMQIGGNLLTILSGSVLTAIQKNHTTVKILVIFSTFFLLAFILISQLNYTAYSVKYIFYIWYILSFLQGLVLFSYTYYKYLGKVIIGKWVSVSFIKIIRFSFLAFVINLIFMSAAKIPIFLLPYKVSADEAGNYIQAFKLLEYMNAIVMFIYFPVVALSAGRREKTEEIILFLVRTFNTITILFSVFVILFGKLLFPIVFGAGFISMYAVFLYLIPAFIATCSSAFYTAFFFGKGLLRYNLLSACILLLLQFLLFFPFTSQFSTKGAAMAQSIAYSLSLFTDIYLFKKIYPHKITEILFIKRSDVQLIYSFIYKKKLFTRYK